MRCQKDRYNKALKPREAICSMHGVLSDVEFATKQLIEEKQKLYEEGNLEELKKMKRKISKSVRKDREAQRIQNFEEELWFDIKRAKAPYLPKHIKLKEKSGETAKTTRRPHILADYFEEKQWGETKTENEETNWPNENCSRK